MKISGEHIRLDAEAVIIRLEEAGRTLLALPNTGPSTRLVQSGMEWIRDASEACSQERVRIRPSYPSAVDITRMDQALAWIPLIPQAKYVLRRVVGARCLVNPMTDRHLYSWRRLGQAVGADHKAVKRWHSQGIDIIVALIDAERPSPSAQRPTARRVRTEPAPRPAEAARS